jgi:hypothetical protein
MRIECEHGFYRFYPELSSEIDAVELFGLGLVKHGIFYTFPALVSAPTYSIKGVDNAIATYSGTPAEVMRQNKFVYSIADDAIVPMSSISGQVEILSSGNYLACKTIPQAGWSVYNTAVVDFTGRIDLNSGMFIFQTKGA